MADYKYIGVMLRKDDDSGIAVINVEDLTTSTMIVTNERLELFQKDQDATFNKYESLPWIHKVSPASHSYRLTVTHAGIHHPSAVGPSYSIQVDGYFTINLLNAPEADTTVRFWNTLDEGNSLTDYAIENGGSISIVGSQTFDGNDTDVSFSLSGNRWASVPYRFSIDGGSTWLWPTSYLLTWGSNSPDYDDGEMTSGMKFTVKFNDPPATGTGNVVIEYIPFFEKYRVRTVLKHPNDGASFKDFTSPYRLLDLAVDLAP